MRNFGARNIIPKLITTWDFHFHFIPYSILTIMMMESLIGSTYLALEKGILFCLLKSRKQALLI
jgi:hypothetical protein